MRRFIFSISALFLLSLVLVFPVFAANEEKVIVLPEGETVERDYFSIASRSEVSGTVNGDAYVVGGEAVVDGVVNGDLLTAGGNVIISGEITGDVRVAGGNVTFSEATIGGNVTAGGGNVTLDSATQIEGSIVAGAGNLQVFAPIGRGAVIGGGSILLANSIGDNVMAGSESLSLTTDASINGNLTYWSENEANIASGATISGVVKHEMPKNANRDKEFGKNAAAFFAGLAILIKILDIFWLTIIGLVLIHLFPKFSLRTSEYTTKKLGWALLAGLGTLILLPIAGVILMITIIGMPIALVLFFAFMLIFWIGRIFAIYALGIVIMNKLGKKDVKALSFMVGMLIYLLLSILPVIGFITSAVVSLAGVGALLVTKGQVFKELRAKNIL